MLIDDLLIDATPLSEALISEGCENTGASVTENGGLITIQIFGSCCCLGEALGFDTWSATFEVIECPEIENIELREDSGMELREDGGLELRE